MDPRAYERVTEVFQEVCDAPPAARRALLDTRCGDDTALREAVERLLEQDSVAEGFLEPSRDSDTSASTARTGLIKRVGQYDVVKELGHGGMGVVLRAMQQTPKREVAIKLIKPEFFGHAAAARLEQEAELLGRLRHPGIAQIFEAGRARVVDDTGEHMERPFIAMELVEGVPLNTFAQHNQLTNRERVRLLVKLCDAMQHAHQRGVVHLDLKPANILVDENGSPRVLDFGVARAIEHGVEARLAEGGSVVGTLVYMPPEQLTGHMHDLDTRADIFALGAVGFELLTGNAPRRISQSRIAKPVECIDAHQAVRDAMLSALVAPTPKAHEINPDVDGELSAVLDKAMAPDREGRYASIGQFGADLKRWLDSTPVEARSGGVIRRARLYARRHRPVVIAGSAAGLAAAAAVGLLVFGIINAHALAEREREATRAAERATIEAEAEAQRAGRMSAFLQNAIFGVDPEEVGPDASFFDALEYASQRIHRDLADAPLVEAEVRYSLGFVYRRHSMFGPARRNIQAALRIWREQLGPSHPKSVAAAEEIAYLMLLVDGQAQAAADAFVEILAIQESAGRSASAEAGWQNLKLGRALFALDRLPQAEAALERSGDLLARHYGEAFRARAMAWRALAVLAAGEPFRARQLATDALQLVDGASEQAYAEGHVRLVLARVLVDAGALDDARANLDLGLTILAARLPDDHIDIADAHEVATRLELAAGNTDAAKSHALACRRIRLSRLGPDHPDLLAAKALHAMAEIAPQRPIDAMHRLEALFHDAEQVVGPDHRLCLEMLQMGIDAAVAGGDELAARNKRQVLDALKVRRLSRTERVAHPGQPG